MAGPEGTTVEGAFGAAGERSTRFPSPRMPGLAQPGAAPSKRTETPDIAQPPKPPGVLPPSGPDPCRLPVLGTRPGVPGSREQPPIRPLPAPPPPSVSLPAQD
jgi:hypothetical protein